MPFRRTPGSKSIHPAVGFVFQKGAAESGTPLRPAPYINMAGPHPFNKDGVWQAGGVGFRWKDDIRMQN